MKTKPTQHSIKELRGLGIQPDAIICRSDRPLTKEAKDKIALFGDIEKEGVIQEVDVDNIYEVPLLVEEEGLADIVIDKLALTEKVSEPDLTEWKELVSKMKNLEKRVTIGIVGKYVELPDAYISINEALNHAGITNNTEVEIKLLYAEDLEEDVPEKHLSDLDGILVPGGFGDRGIDGKTKTIQYARENEIPFFGICLGMQCAVIEFARNVVGLDKAHSFEFDPSTPHPVIDLMPEQKEIEDLGGTMRLGQYPCALKEGSESYKAYQENKVMERHRHRYELNNDYRQKLQDNGMLLSGLSPDDKLVEIIEIEDHPWFVGVQFHPEFKSRPNRPHPLFINFVKAALEN